MQAEAKPAATGGCLCGAVRYRIDGRLRDVIVCHCWKCRRFHGHVGAYTSVRRDQLALIADAALTWYRSVTDETYDVHRGFCRECGSSLFWDPRSAPNIGIAAGSLDAPTGLKTIGHVWISQMADYYSINDGLPQFAKSHGGTLG